MAQDIYKIEFTKDELLTMRVALTQATTYLRDIESEAIHSITEREHDELWNKLFSAEWEQDKMPPNELEPEGTMEPIMDESGIVVGETPALLKEQAE